MTSSPTLYPVVVADDRPQAEPCAPREGRRCRLEPSRYKQVERLVDDAPIAPVAPPDRPIRCWRRPKSGSPCSSSATTSPSMIGLVRSRATSAATETPRNTRRHPSDRVSTAAPRRRRCTPRPETRPIWSRTATRDRRTARAPALRASARRTGPFAVDRSSCHSASPSSSRAHILRPRQPDRTPAARWASLSGWSDRSPRSPSPALRRGVGMLPAIGCESTARCRPARW